MMLSLDETRVKMSNLTRISDVKNAVYCENLIADDHHSSSSSEVQVPSKDSVKKTFEQQLSSFLIDKLRNLIFRSDSLPKWPSQTE